MAGERRVASKWLLDGERREEEEPWAERPCTLAMVGRAGVVEGLR